MRKDLGVGFLGKTEKCLGKKEEEDGDEEGAPDIAGERRITGLACLIEKSEPGAVEDRVEFFASEDFRRVLVGRAVDGDKALTEAEDAGLVFGIGGIWSAVVVEANAGFSGQLTGRVSADGG